MMKRLHILCLFFVCGCKAHAYNFSNTTETTLENETITQIITNELTTDISVDSKQAGYWSIPDINSLGCGNDFSCVRYRSSKTTCSGMECAYMLAYKPPTDDYVEFFLAARDAEFVAVGFTDDNRLVGTELLTCSKDHNQVVAKVFFWPGTNEKSKLQDVYVPNNNYFQKISGEIEGDGLWCLIKRQLEPWANDIKNLKTNNYQVYLWGEITKTGHPIVVDIELSPSDWPKLDFKVDLTTKLNEENKIFSEEILPEDVNCKEISCVRFFKHSSETPGNDHCSYKECSFLLAYQSKTPSSRTWPVFLSVANAEFVAAGLTSDPKTKDNTEIFGCKKTKDGLIETFHYWFSSPSQSYPQSQHIGLKLLNGNITGNGFWCNIARPLHPGGNAWNLSLPTYHLYAWGSLKEDGEPAIWNNISNVYTSNSNISLEAKTQFYEQVRMSRSGSNLNLYNIILIIQLVSFSLCLTQV